MANRPTEFSHLGRPTKRGIKTCTFCGYTNGTKSLRCKNCLIELRSKINAKCDPGRLTNLEYLGGDLDDIGLFNLDLTDIKVTESKQKKMKLEVSKKLTVSVNSTPKTNKGRKKSTKSNFELNFDIWLEDLIERINQNIEIKLPGDCVEILEFSPTNFVNSLLQRLSDSNDTNNKKLCLPHKTEIIKRINNPPLGDFVTYTWKLINLKDVQKVFHANGFSVNNVKRLQLLSHPSASNFKINKFSNSGYKDILPTEISVKLRLDSTQSDEPGTFNLLWTPNLCKRQGELKLQFQYDHFINNNLSKYCDVKSLFESLL